MLDDQLEHIDCTSVPIQDIAQKTYLNRWSIETVGEWGSGKPIFMISGANELLQQQLEYTLLKPDCHSWQISKMQSGRQDTLEERYAIKFCVSTWKNATETYGMLQTAFGASCMNRASAFEWYKRFKEGRESVRDDERCERSKEVRTPEFIGLMVKVRIRVAILRF